MRKSEEPDRMNAMQEYRFQAVIQKNADLDAAYIIVPINIRDVFGKGRLSVKALFDGVEYNGSIVNMGVKDKQGTVCYIIGVPKAIRKQIGKSFGDELSVVIRRRDR